MLNFKEYNQEFNSILSEVELDESELQVLDEVLDVAARRKKALMLKRYKSRMLLARKIKAKRFPTMQVLKQRAIKRARAKIAKRLTQGRGKGALSYQQRAILDKRIQGMRGGVARLAQKLLRQVRQDAQQRLRGKKDKVGKGPSVGAAI